MISTLFLLRLLVICAPPALKSVYGLKQVAQLWNQTLHQAIMNIGLKCCNYTS
jgi:hypothetical protein